MKARSMGKEGPPVKNWWAFFLDFGRFLGTEVHNMERRVMGVKDLAEYIDIKRQTIYNEINNGTFPIPFKKVFGRIKFEKEDVDHFLDKLPLYRNLKKN